MPFCGLINVLASLTKRNLEMTIRLKLKTKVSAPIQMRFGTWVSCAKIPAKSHQLRINFIGFGDFCFAQNVVSLYSFVVSCGNFLCFDESSAQSFSSYSQISKRSRKFHEIIVVLNRKLWFCCEIQSDTKYHRKNKSNSRK